MVAVTSLGLAAVAFVAVHARQSPPPFLARVALHTRFHRLIWHDEFSGPRGSRPNRSHWTPIVGPTYAHKELEYYTARPRNVSLDGSGHLQITARRESRGSGPARRPYTSARLETGRLFQVRYGRIEARIKVPYGRGLWSAFWGVGSDYPRVGWPQSGELDMVEYIGRAPWNAFGTIHGPAAGYPLGYQHISAVRLRRRLGAQYHVFGVEWTPGRIQFTLDGMVYATRTPADLDSGERWVFDKPFDLILNLSVGGSWPGPPSSATRFPARMLVDWVRVYR